MTTSQTRSLRRALLLAAVLPLAHPALAQDQAAPITLDTVIISGGLSPIAPDAYGRAYSVISGDDLREQGISSVKQALSGLPGVSVTETGGSFATLRMRGAPANHALILIDGVEAQGGGGDYILSGLATDDIARIEVLRGPQSVFYGSRASAGVVNIVTLRGAEQGRGAALSATWGNGWSLSGRAHVRGERGGLALSYATRENKGYDASGKGGERDGIRRRALSLHGDWQATEDLEIGFSQSLARETYGYDNSDWMATDEAGYMVDTPDLNSRRDERAGQVHAALTTLDGRMTHRLSYERSRYAQEFPGDFPYEMLGITRALKYRASLSLDGAPVDQAGQMVNVMADWTRWNESNSYVPVQEKSTRSVALEYRGFFDSGLDVQAGLRRDRNKGFRNFTSWTIGLSQDLGRGLRLHASAGAGMANPTFTELFGYPGFSIGNPDLSPEINRSLDLGLEAQFADARIDVTLFREKVTDLIGAGSCGGQTCYVNYTGDSLRKGVEIAGDWQIRDDIALRGSYSYIDAKLPDGGRVAYVPRHELTLGAAWRAERVTLGGDLRHVAGLVAPQGWAGGDPAAELPDFTTVDIWGDYRLNDDLKLTGRIDNLFDADAKQAWGYGWQGRRAQIGISASW